MARNCDGVRIPGSDPLRPVLLVAFRQCLECRRPMALVSCIRCHPRKPWWSFITEKGLRAPSTGTPSAQALIVGPPSSFMTRLARPFIGGLGFSIWQRWSPRILANLPRDLEQVVLVTPFDSLAKVAADSLPYLPVRWLVSARKWTP